MTRNKVAYNVGNTNQLTRLKTIDKSFTGIFTSKKSVIKEPDLPHYLNKITYREFSRNLKRIRE